MFYKVFVLFLTELNFSDFKILIIKDLIFWLACGFIIIKLQNNLTNYEISRVLPNYLTLILLKINNLN
jgi:hypothetical protein